LPLGCWNEYETRRGESIKAFRLRRLSQTHSERRETGLSMQVVDGLIQLLQSALDLLVRGVTAIIRFIPVLWEWTISQVLAIPWNRLDDLPLWKILILVLTGAAVGWLLYSAGRILVEAGEKALTQFFGLLSAFIKTILPILFAGALAAGGAWIINNVHFNFDHYNQTRWR
jgi:hypothetical protein